jgi:hypothetical protein
MRAIISKVLTGSIIAGAALAVSACGSKTENTADANMTTEMNASESMDTTTTDNMTAVDGAMNGGMMANDTMGNDMMMSNDTMSMNASNAM